MKCWACTRRCSGGHLEPQSDSFQRQSEAKHRGDVRGLGAVLGWPDEVSLKEDVCDRGCAHPYFAQLFVHPADGGP